MLKLGILGLSEGNGHPYSWSAIFNGYDSAAMSECPFPVIPQYLGQHTFPEEAIPGAAVTHIWTQDPVVSAHVARAALIDAVVENSEEMIGKVDAILLARDDAENHLEMARPFIEAGLPIYIDKPLAYSVREAREILDGQRYPGQVFSCSALAYAAELQVGPEVLVRIGKVRRIEAEVIKSWGKYAIHIIDPVLRAVDRSDRPLSTRVSRKGSRTCVEVDWSSNVTTELTATGEATGRIALRVLGDRGEQELVFKDTFAAFKSALEDFVAIARRAKEPVDAERLLLSIGLVEAGIGE